jgi:hypothetical protein
VRRATRFRRRCIPTQRASRHGRFTDVGTRAATTTRSGVTGILLSPYPWRERSGVLSKTVRLGHPGKGSVTWVPGADSELDALLTQFLAHVAPPITEARELAQRMARLTGGPRIAASLDNSGDLPV